MAAEGRRLFYVEEKLWPDYQDDDWKKGDRFKFCVNVKN